MTKRAFKIEHSVDLPEGTKLSKRKVKQPQTSQYETIPLTQMKRGDSFHTTQYSTARSLRGILHKKSRRGNMRFISRSTRTGVRVWRVQ